MSSETTATPSVPCWTRVQDFHNTAYEKVKNLTGLNWASDYLSVDSSQEGVLATAKKVVKFLLSITLVVPVLLSVVEILSKGIENVRSWCCRSSADRTDNADKASDVDGTDDAEKEAEIKASAEAIGAQVLEHVMPQIQHAVTEASLAAARAAASAVAAANASKAANKAEDAAANDAAAAANFAAATANLAAAEKADQKE